MNFVQPVIRRALSRSLLACVLAASTGGALIAGQAPSGSAKSPSTSAATSYSAADPVLAARVANLVKQLAHKDFAMRESAQQALVLLGDGASELVLPHLDAPDPEVAHRVLAALATPNDPGVRVRVALRLIDSVREERVWRGVNMLFEDAQAIMLPLDAALASPLATPNVAAAAPFLRESLMRFISFEQQSNDLVRRVATQPGGDEKAATFRANVEDQRESLMIVALVETTEAMLTRPSATQPRPQAAAEAPSTQAGMRGPPNQNPATRNRE